LGCVQIRRHDGAEYGIGHLDLENPVPRLSKPAPEGAVFVFPDLPDADPMLIAPCRAAVIGPFQHRLRIRSLPGLQADAGADTSKLQHFIGLQIQQNAAAQGANTDAARALAAQAVLPGSSPAQAIKAITRINDAFATGLDLFNRGIQATVANPGNTKDVFAIRDFQNAWSVNMDPRIFLLENAVQAGDKAEVEKIKKQLGPEGIKQLMTKARTLQRLIQSGAINGP